MTISSNKSDRAYSDIARIDISDGMPSFQAKSRTLLIFEADGLPIGQQWLSEGERATLTPDISTRMADRRSRSNGRPFNGKVSVVICTRDRADELRRCLASFPHQSRPPDEIIVVDNASVDDRTREVVKAAEATYVREDRPGLDFARNSGAQAATGELILYTDDDTELHPLWVENILAAFDAPDIAAVTGLVLPARLQTEAQWIFETEWSFGRGFDRIDYGREFYEQYRRYGVPAWIIGAGANMAFRRSIFDEIGYFDERLDVGQAGCSGDSEYWYRILAAGKVCRYEPTAVMLHHHRLEMDGLESQIFHYMRGHTAALMVQHERTGDRGNLRRAFITMPLYYARRSAGRLMRGKTPSNRFLTKQIRGAMSGIWFYFGAKRPGA